MSGLYWISKNDGEDAFPSVETALREPDGLLAVGGKLSSTRLLAAYRQGIFPWYSVGQPVLWWSPDPRCVLYPEQLKVSRSLRKTLRKGLFTITLDHDFEAVVESCAAPREDDAGTWITPAIKRSYSTLHQMGIAHSVEVWQDGQLVGGLYGVALGRVFFGESMFSRVSDASKAGFVTLVQQLHRWGYPLIDCQVHSDHLESLGAVNIPRGEFIAMLDQHCNVEVSGNAWTLESDLRKGANGHLNRLHNAQATGDRSA
jgi:leucyl/phenylalanyl-tRNA--protein transferase